MPTTMPFGKYKGWPLDQVPDDYLEWLQTIDLRPRLLQAVMQEAAYREAMQEETPDRRRGHGTARPVAQSAQSFFAWLIDCCQRDVMLEFHSRTDPMVPLDRVM